MQDTFVGFHPSTLHSLVLSATGYSTAFDVAAFGYSLNVLKRRLLHIASPIAVMRSEALRRVDAACTRGAGRDAPDAPDGVYFESHEDLIALLKHHIVGTEEHSEEPRSQLNVVLTHSAMGHLDMALSGFGISQGLSSENNIEHGEGFHTPSSQDLERTASSGGMERTVSMMSFKSDSVADGEAVVNSVQVAPAGHPDHDHNPNITLGFEQTLLKRHLHLTLTPVLTLPGGAPASPDSLREAA